MSERRSPPAPRAAAAPPPPRARARMANRGWYSAAALAEALDALGHDPAELAARALDGPADALAMLRDLHIRRTGETPQRGSTAVVHRLVKLPPGGPALPLVLKLSRDRRAHSSACWIFAERLLLARWQHQLGPHWPARLALPGPLLVHRLDERASRVGFLMDQRGATTLWNELQGPAPNELVADWLLQVLLLWAALLWLPAPACVYDPALTNYGLVRGRVHGFDFGMLCLGQFPEQDPAAGCCRRLGELLRRRLDPEAPDSRARDPDHAVFHGFPPPPDRPPADAAQLAAEPTLDRLALQLAAHLANENHRRPLPCPALARLADRCLPWDAAQRLLRIANPPGQPALYRNLYEASFCRRVHGLDPDDPRTVTWKRLRDECLRLAGGLAPAADALRAKHADLLDALPPLQELLTA